MTKKKKKIVMIIEKINFIYGLRKMFTFYTYVKRKKLKEKKK